MIKFIEDELNLEAIDMEDYDYTAEEVEAMDEEKLEDAGIEDADEYIEEYKLDEKREILIYETAYVMEQLLEELKAELDLLEEEVA